MKTSSTRLRDLVSSIKSANAGASQLTFDIGFETAALYRSVVDNGSIDAERVAALYGVPAEKVEIHPYDPASVIKITIPRGIAAGGIDERDFDGVQQFPPLLDLDVNLDPKLATDTMTPAPNMAEAPFPATLLVAEFIERYDIDTAPALLLSRAKELVLDCLGVMVAALGHDIVPILLATLPPHDGAGATRVGHGVGSAADAALFNSALAHCLEFDDSTLNPVGHPGCIILPALFALGEQHRVSGARLLEAWLVGLEVHSRLGQAQRGNWSFGGGWLPIGHISLIGTAAACARLLLLSAAQAEHALGFAAQFCGQLSVNAGSMAKPLGAGHAARAGMLAAQLAAAGATATSAILERPGGFADTFFGRDAHDLPSAFAKLGRVHHLEEVGVAIKRYPSCYGCHWGVDAVVDLMSKHGLQAGDVESIVLVHPSSAAFLDHPLPRNEEEAKFSHEYNLAIAALRGIPRVQDFEPATIASEPLQAMLERVRAVVHPPGTDDVAARAYQVTIVTGDGRRLTHGVPRPLGHPRRPMSAGDLEDKYRHCVSPWLSDVDADFLRSVVGALEVEPDLRGIAGVLARAARR